MTYAVTITLSHGITISIITLRFALHYIMVLIVAVAESFFIFSTLFSVHPNVITDYVEGTLFNSSR